MKTDFTIREAQQTDTIALKELFQNTVLAVNSKDYSQAEVEDWASCGDDLSNIEEMIKTHYFIVAVNQQSQIVGFSSITSQGYLHSMFVHKDFQAELLLLHGVIKQELLLQIGILLMVVILHFVTIAVN